MADDKWKGFEIIVDRDAIHKDRYKVEFQPEQLMAPVGSEGEFQLVPSYPVVTVEKQDDYRAIAFADSSDPFPGLSKEDYQKKALEAVQEYLEQTS